MVLRGSLLHREDCQCPFCGGPKSVDHRRRIGDNNRRRAQSHKLRGPRPLEVIKKISENGKCQKGCQCKRHIHSNDHRSKIAKKTQASPNLKETQLFELVKVLGFYFVGDGQLVVEGKCPDFYNGQFQVIELYGDYWHRNHDPQDRINLFKRNGYECLVIWEYELHHPDAVINRVKDFCKDSVLTRI